MIIPIGVDCGLAVFLKNSNMRGQSLPFDWTVAYNGVSACISDNFKYFLPEVGQRINKYDIYFHHDFMSSNLLNDDIDKYKRRCERLINILENTTEKLVFCRKGHSCHHHYEHDSRYFNITNDLDDVETLDTVLKSKYPKLDYKIIVILICEKCFIPKKEYKSTSDKVEIYNIVEPGTDASLNFNNCVAKIFTN
jgi:Putative papain-like cysteine peptidase (DUF1796)